MEGIVSPLLMKPRPLGIQACVKLLISLKGVCYGVLGSVADHFMSLATCHPQKANKLVSQHSLMTNQL